MFTTTTGRTFLKEYNRQAEEKTSPEEFFYNIYIPLFFDHNKYMMTAGNSPLENPKISWTKMIKEKKPYESEEKRKERIKKIADKIESGPIDASIAVGYPTDDETNVTSGQITTMSIDYSKDDIYLSWIGASLGIGIQGGFTVLFNDATLLYDTFSGWKHYRYYLERYPKLRGNQINTWNGKWICHLYDKRKYDPDNPLFGFPDPTLANNGLMEFDTISWVNLLVKIAQQRKDHNYLGYVYNIGQTNTTIGFIPFKLPQIIRPFELFKKIFGNNLYLKEEKKIIELFGGEIGFKTACQKGALGIEALEPKGLKKYMPKYHGQAKMPNYRKANEDQILSFNTYKIWVLAMLNKEELWEKSRQIAKLLETYESGAGKGRMDRRNSVKCFLESYSRKTFLESLIPIIESTNEASILYEAGEIVNKMSADDVKYFVTLTRFQYASLKEK